jgi:hypothetical protein
MSIIILYIIGNPAYIGIALLTCPFNLTGYARTLESSVSHTKLSGSTSRLEELTLFPSL